MRRLKDLWARAQATTPLRAWKRYNDAHGNILAGGVGYFAFFSIFPAVALAFTVFGIVLRGHPDLVQRITEALSQNLPGFVKDAKHPRGIISVSAPGTATLTITGAISVVGLVLSGLGWLSSLRESIRAVFGLDASPGNPVTTKLRDLGVLLTLGVGIALSAILTTSVGSAASWIGSHIGLGDYGWVVTLAGLLVGATLDTAFMLLLLRVLTGIGAPWRVLLRGALIGGVGFTLVKLFASALIGRASHNPVFASVAIVVGLLFWLNLISRLVLLAGAWAANDLDAYRQRTPGVGVEDPSTAGEPVAELPLESASEPSTGRGSKPVLVRSVARTDRLTLGAGAVLGAALAVAAGAGVRAARSLARRR